MNWPDRVTERRIAVGSGSDSSSQTVKAAPLAFELALDLYFNASSSSAKGLILFEGCLVETR